MKNELLLCEYSYHNQRKHFNWRHGLDYYFIRLQTEGHCCALVNGKMEDVTPGDLLLYKPGEACELVIDEYIDQSGNKTISSGDYYLMCKGPWIDQWWKRVERTTLKHVNNERKLLVLWKEIILEKRRIYEKDEELIDYLHRSLCLSIDNATKDYKTVNQPTLPVLTMKRYIEEHANESFKIKDVANHVGFSVSRASYLFKENFGKTMIEYATEIRMNTALKLIRYSDMSLEQIAEISGFGSYTYFHRVFRKKHGKSPTDFFSNEEKHGPQSTGLNP